MCIGKTYFAIGDDDGIHVFDSLKEATDFMANTWGYSPQDIVDNSDARILMFEANGEPLLKNAKCDWSL